MVKIGAALTRPCRRHPRLCKPNWCIEVQPQRAVPAPSPQWKRKSLVPKPFWLLQLSWESLHAYWLCRSHVAISLLFRGAKQTRDWCSACPWGYTHWFHAFHQVTLKIEGLNFFRKISWSGAMNAFCLHYAYILLMATAPEEHIGTYIDHLIDFQSYVIWGSYKCPTTLC